MLHFLSLHLRVPVFCFAIVSMFPMVVCAQKGSVVQVHADKSSGYGVAYGGPQKSPDLIVTALHIVAGKKTILVKWQGKSAYAKIEKIYKPSDLALLRLQTPLGVPPLTLYSGEPPWGDDVNFWEIPINASAVTAKTTYLEERTSLSRISPRIANNPAGLSKSLCSDGGQFYPGMTTEVINFKEPNIRKAHSGSPITYGDKILGMVDGGAKLTDGKACVWAIPASEFTKLFNQGTPPTASMQACDSPTAANKYMYSGMRSDNPLLSPEEANEAEAFENPMLFSESDGTTISLYHEYRMPFAEVFESLFEEEQIEMAESFETEESITLDDLLDATVDLYVEELTGITVMVPAQCNLSASSDDYGTLITTTSPGGLVSMSVYISSNYSMEEGMDSLQAFKSYIESQGWPMQPLPEDIEDYSDDSDTPYYSEYIEHAFTDEDDFLVSGYYADLIVNDGDFLAIIVSADYAGLANNESERLFLRLIETCALLSDFTLY